MFVSKPRPAPRRKEQTRQELILPKDGDVASTAEDAGEVVPLSAEGDDIGMGDVQKLKPFLPVEFWDNRDFFYSYWGRGE